MRERAARRLRARAGLRGSGAFLLGTVAVWTLVRGACGDGLPYLGYVNGLGFGWTLVAALASGILLASRAFFLAGAGFLLMIAVAWPSLPSLRRPLPPPPGATPLAFATASLRTMNPDMAAAAATLADTGAEILTVQEAADPALLRRELERRTGRTWNAVSQGTSVTLSTLPMRPAGTNGECLKVLVTVTPTRLLSVWNLHAPKDYDVPDNLLAYREGLLREIDAEHPDIVAGDFNATPWNDLTRALTTRMADAYIQAGTWPGMTFPTRARRSGVFGAFARIDHIFLSGRLTATFSRVGQGSRGADHYPVVARLALGI